MKDASPRRSATWPRFLPPVLIDGRPVAVAAIAGSSRSKNAYPVACAWSSGANSRPTKRLIRPGPEWIARGDRIDGEGIHHLTLNHLMQDGIDAVSVAQELQALAREHVIVTLVSSVDCAGLGQLISLASGTVTMGRLSALDIATAVAAELGLGEVEFAMAAANAWGRSLSNRPVAQRVEAGVRMIQSTIDAAAGFGLLGARKSIDVTTSLPLSRLHDWQATAGRAWIEPLG